MARNKIEDRSLVKVQFGTCIENWKIEVIGGKKECQIKVLEYLDQLVKDKQNGSK